MAGREIPSRVSNLPFKAQPRTSQTYLWVQSGPLLTSTETLLDRVLYAGIPPALSPPFPCSGNCVGNRSTQSALLFLARFGSSRRTRHYQMWLESPGLQNWLLHACSGVGSFSQERLCFSKGLVCFRCSAGGSRIECLVVYGVEMFMLLFTRLEKTLRAKT